MSAGASPAARAETPRRTATTSSCRRLTAGVRHDGYSVHVLGQLAKVGMDRKRGNTSRADDEECLLGRRPRQWVRRRRIHTQGGRYRNRTASDTCVIIYYIDICTVDD